MYLPETPPLPPIKPGDPDYDPFAKPRRRSCSYRSPAPGVWICPTCCTILGTVGKRYKTTCPACGQKVKELSHETL